MLGTSSPTRTTACTTDRASRGCETLTSSKGLRASVVIVGYDGETFLGACLESLADTDVLSSEYELLFVDNASSDGTVALVQRYRERFPNFRLIRNERNLGFPAAVNQAAELARSPVLVLLNQDTVVERRWLSELLSPLERDPSLAAVGSRVVNGQGPSLYAAGLEVLYGGICVVHEGNRRMDAVSGCSMAVRLDALRRVGGLDGSLFMYGEDLDLGYRLRGIGGRIAYAKGSVAHHRAVRRDRASTRVYLFYMARNRTLICLRNYRRKRLYLVADLFVLFPLTALAELVRSRRRRLAVRWLLEARMDSLRRSFEILREPATI
jgi:GT2 family glycosyltransferase